MNNPIPSQETVKFIEKAKQKHGDLYSYSLVHYIRSDLKVLITCPKHGPFENTPNRHLQGRGCKKCGKHKQFDEVVEVANMIHSGKYYYFNPNNFPRLGQYDRINITCPDHGTFDMRVRDHITGDKHGCGWCSGRYKKTTEMFIIKARKKHGDRFDYSEANYQGWNIPLMIICPDHGPFYQTPDIHYRSKTACKGCCGAISKAERAWLDSLSIPLDYRQKTITLSTGKRYRVDAYDPTSRTVYEFWGDIWHGNPDVVSLTDCNPQNKISYQKLYDNTLEKRKAIIADGYKLLEIWEHDWKKQ